MQCFVKCLIGYRFFRHLAVSTLAKGFSTMKDGDKGWGASIEEFTVDLVYSLYASVFVNLVKLKLADYPCQLWSHLSDT